MTTETRSAISTNETEDSETRNAIRSDGTGDPEARSATEHHQVLDHETLDGVLNSPTRLSEAETTVDDEVNYGEQVLGSESSGSEVRANYHTQGEANLSPGPIHERGSTSWSHDQNFAKLLRPNFEPQTSARAKVIQTTCTEQFETQTFPEKSATLQQSTCRRRHHRQVRSAMEFVSHTR